MTVLIRLINIALEVFSSMNLHLIFILLILVFRIVIFCMLIIEKIYFLIYNILRVELKYYYYSIIQQ